MKNSGGETKSKRLTRYGWYELPEENPVVKFCQDSGLHGIKYITGPEQHLCERLLWLVAFFIATVAGSVLIYNTWDQYNNLPVVFVRSQKRLSIQEIPFPSVTVCPLNRVKKETYEKYEALSKQTDDGNDTTIEEAKDILKILDALCDPRNILIKSLLWNDGKVFGMGTQSAFLNLELSRNFNNESKIMKLLDENSQSCGEMMPTILFKNYFLVTSFVVSKVETDFGICCSFNVNPFKLLKRWNQKWSAKFNGTLSTDTIISINTTEFGDFPIKQNIPGLNHGLSIVLETKMNESHCKSPDLNGFLMSIANPLNIPSMKDKEIVVEFNTEVFFTLNPKITLADDSIKRFTPEKRDCYFGNEKTLKQYLFYTKYNCLQECTANLTAKYCQVMADCWGFFNQDLGVERDWIYDHFCTPRDGCNEDKYSPVHTLDLEKTCNVCLPTCNDIKYAYNAEVKHLKDDYIQQLEELPLLGGKGKGNKSLVHVYFDEYTFTPTLRKEQFGILELLANSGGLLGLCLGFSGISILEIIYYFTVRVCFRRFRDKVLQKNNDVCQDDSSSQIGIDEKNQYLTHNES